MYVYIYIYTLYYIRLQFSSRTILFGYLAKFWGTLILTKWPRYREVCETGKDRAVVKSRKGIVKYCLQRTD